VINRGLARHANYTQDVEGGGGRKPRDTLTSDEQTSRGAHRNNLPDLKLLHLYAQRVDAHEERGAMGRARPAMSTPCA
jgi:hypothetical protein